MGLTDRYGSESTYEKHMNQSKAFPGILEYSVLCMYVVSWWA